MSKNVVIDFGKKEIFRCKESQEIIDKLANNEPLKGDWVQYLDESGDFISGKTV